MTSIPINNFIGTAPAPALQHGYLVTYSTGQPGKVTNPGMVELWLDEPWCSGTASDAALGLTRMLREAGTIPNGAGVVLVGVFRLAGTGPAPDLPRLIEDEPSHDQPLGDPGDLAASLPPISRIVDGADLT